MDRGSSTAFQQEIVKSANRPFHLLNLHLDSGSYYLSDCYISVTYNSNTYSPVGSLLSFTNITETNDVVVESLSISLSGVDQTYTNLLLNQNYIDRKIEIYKGFLNSSEQLINDPILIFSGRINNPIVQEDPDSGKSSLIVSASSHFIDFNKKTGRFTNNESQQSFFPGDTGFRFASASVKELNWGQTAGATAMGSGSAASGGEITSISNNLAPGEKSIFTELRPTNPAFSLKSGSILINVSYANHSTSSYSVGDKVKINGFVSTTFADGETVLSSALNFDEGAAEQTIIGIDSDGYGFDINAPDSLTSVKSGKFGGSEITIDDNLIMPVLVETTSGSNLITVNADNSLNVGDFLSLNLDTTSVGGIDSVLLTQDQKVTAVTSDTITVAVTTSTVIIGEAIITTSGSNTLIIDKYNHGLVIGDTFVMANAVAVGGIPVSELNATHTVVAQTSDNQFTVTVSSNATSSVRGGGLATTIDGVLVLTNPIETTSGSTTLKVHKKAHGLSNNDVITLEDLTDVGGVLATTLNATHTVVDATTSTDYFTITVSDTATSSAFGGGVGVYELPIKATGNAKFGSPNSTINMPGNIR